MINSKPIEPYVKLFPLEDFLKREKEIFADSENKWMATTVDDWVGKLKDGFKQHESKYLKINLRVDVKVDISSSG